MQRASIWQILRSGMAAVVACSLAINLLMLTVPLYTMQLLDRVLASGHLETLLLLSVIAAFALAVLGVLEATRASLLARLQTHLGERLSGPLLEAEADRSARTPGQGTSGLRDLAQLRNLLTGPAANAVADAPWLPVFLVLVWLLHPLFGVFSLISALLLAGLAVLGELLTRHPLRIAGDLASLAQARADAATRHAGVVRAMNLMPAMRRRFDAIHGNVLTLQQQAAERSGALLGAARFTRLFVQTGVMGLGAWLVMRHEISPGTMIAASILMSRALAPVEQLIPTWRTILQARVAAARLRATLAEAGACPTALPLPAPQGPLVVDGLGYVLPCGERQVLREVSFRVEPGAVLAVIGPSAAGKSTLCRLLAGALVPSAGTVRLDGADLGSQVAAGYGRHIGYLPQEVGLFAGTVADNIARLDEPDPRRVVEAARRAGAHAMILALPGGYQTEIADDGLQLSGGQRQRIGLARALYDAPHLIVLDEPNAHLDGEGEAALADALAELKRSGAVVVVVNHRPNLLRHADQVLVLENGAVSRFGPRDEVLRSLIRPPRAA
jgi:PrtD family type I secretion system ABC transporter